MANALRQLAETGAAVWSDDLTRAGIQLGELTRLVDDLGVVGITIILQSSRNRSAQMRAAKAKCMIKPCEAPQSAKPFGYSSPKMSELAYGAFTGPIEKEIT